MEQVGHFEIQSPRLYVSGPGHRDVRVEPEVEEHKMEAWRHHTWGVTVQTGTLICCQSANYDLEHVTYPIRPQSLDGTV